MQQQRTLDSLVYSINVKYKSYKYIWGHHDRDRMIVGFTTTYAINDSPPHTTLVVSLNIAYGKVYSIQHNVIKFVNDLGQVGGFLHQ